MSHTLKERLMITSTSSHPELSPNCSDDSKSSKGRSYWGWPKSIRESLYLSWLKLMLPRSLLWVLNVIHMPSRCWLRHRRSWGTWMSWRCWRLLYLRTWWIRNTKTAITDVADDQTCLIGRLIRNHTSQPVFPWKRPTLRSDYSLLWTLGWTICSLSFQARK